MWVGGSRGYASITFPKALWVLYSVQFCMLTCLRTGLYLLIENMGNTAEEDKGMWVPKGKEKGSEMPSSVHDIKPTHIISRTYSCLHWANTRLDPLTANHTW